MSITEDVPTLIARLRSERDTALAELAEARKKLERDRARLEAELAEARRERDALMSDLVQANGRVNEERYDHAETCLDLEAVKAARLAALDGQIAAESRLAQAEAALREMREYAEEVMEESDEETTGSTALDHFINLALAAPASSPLLAKLKAAKKMVQALGMVTGHFPANNPKGERAEFICRSCAKEVSEALRLWKEAGGEG